MSGKFSKEILITILVLTLVGVGIYFLIQNFGDKTEQQELVPEDKDSLGEELFEQVKNPTSDLPETNPLEDTANPFEKKGTNPFDSYVNPFK